jgi:hypothetical protein
MTRKRPRRRLSPRAEQVIAALLEHGTQEKAAAAAGISVVTLWRLHRKPEFRKALLEARSDAFSQAIGRLQQGSSAAAATLLRVMCDATSPAASRVRAAQCVLDSAARGIGLEDLEIRLRELENQSSPRGEHSDLGNRNRGKTKEPLVRGGKIGCGSTKPNGKEGA